MKGDNRGFYLQNFLSCWFFFFLFIIITYYYHIFFTLLFRWNPTVAMEEQGCLVMAWEINTLTGGQRGGEEAKSAARPPAEGAADCFICFN